MSRGKSRQDRNQVVPDRRIEAALEVKRRDGITPVEAVRELIEEAYKRGMSAGQMKERLGR